jgi:hypothetical protein
MDQMRPLSAWAVVSLTSAILGWLTALPLLVINYQYIAGSTAGVGLLGPFLLGLLSAALCLLGIIFGVVALARIRNGERRGRGMGWAGIILGGLPLMTYVLFSGRYLLGWW